MDIYEDPKIYDEMVDHVIAECCFPIGRAKALVKVLLAEQGKKPPKRERFSDVHKPWHTAPGPGMQGDIYGADNMLVCNVAMSGREAKQALLLSAPDLRERVYRDRKLLKGGLRFYSMQRFSDAIDKSTARSLKVLKAAGVDMEGME